MWNHGMLQPRGSPPPSMRRKNFRDRPRLPTRAAMVRAAPPRHIVLPTKKVTAEARMGRPTMAMAIHWSAPDNCSSSFAAMLPPQQVALGDVHGADVAVQVDHDAKADGGLRGGQGDAEQRQHEAVGVAQRVAEGDEVDVGDANGLVLTLFS